MNAVVFHLNVYTFSNNVFFFQFYGNNRDSCLRYYDACTWNEVDLELIQMYL